MTFEEGWETCLAHLPEEFKASAQDAWNAARPKPLTTEQIRECWRECEHNAPMAFAWALQEKLGILESPDDA